MQLPMMSAPCSAAGRWCPHRRTTAFCALAAAHMQHTHLAKPRVACEDSSALDSPRCTSHVKLGLTLLWKRQQPLLNVVRGCISAWQRDGGDHAAACIPLTSANPCRLPGTATATMCSGALPAREGQRQSSAERACCAANCAPLSKGGHRWQSGVSARLYSDRPMRSTHADEDVGERRA